MKIEKVVNRNQIQDGDTLIVEGFEAEPIVFKNVTVKRSETDGTEIILKKKGNIYFNLDMYLKGTSYIQDVYIIYPQEERDGKGN
jgi:acyl CoA:acetate/3-ketoacid CoA transferase alpha subunit